MNVQFSIVTLKEKPELASQVFDLIYDSLEYKIPNRPEIDFYPLLGSHNWENCFVFLSNNKVIGHFGTKFRNLKYKEKSIPIRLIGGICVSKEHRGTGIMKKMFEYVNKAQFSKSVISILWSDKNAFYEKFDFFQAGYVNIFKTSPQLTYNSNYLKIKSMDKLTDDEFRIIQKIFTQNIENNFIHFSRDINEWNSIRKISSVQCLLDLNQIGEIKNYAFKSKGQDLEGVIYEIGIPDQPFFLKDSIVWSPLKNINDSQIIGSVYLGLFKLEDAKKASWFFNVNIESEKDLLNHLNSDISNKFLISGADSI